MMALQVLLVLDFVEQHQNHGVATASYRWAEDISKNKNKVNTKFFLLFASERRNTLLSLSNQDLQPKTDTCVSVFKDRTLCCLICIYWCTNTYMQNVSCFSYFLLIRHLNVKISCAFSLLLYACIDFWEFSTHWLNFLDSCYSME